MSLSTGPERSQSRWQGLADCTSNPMVFFGQLRTIAQDHALTISSRADLQAIVDEINPVLYIANQPHATTETGAEPPRMLWPILDADSNVVCTLIADLQLMSSSSECRIKKLSVLGAVVSPLPADENSVDSSVLTLVRNSRVSQTTLQELANNLG